MREIFFEEDKKTETKCHLLQKNKETKCQDLNYASIWQNRQLNKHITFPCFTCQNYSISVFHLVQSWLELIAGCAFTSTSVWIILVIDWVKHHKPSLFFLRFLWNYLKNTLKMEFHFNFYLWVMAKDSKFDVCQALNFFLTWVPLLSLASVWTPCIMPVECM